MGSERVGGSRRGVIITPKTDDFKGMNPLAKRQFIIIWSVYRQSKKSKKAPRPGSPCLSLLVCWLVMVTYWHSAHCDQMLCSVSGCLSDPQILSPASSIMVTSQDYGPIRESVIQSWHTPSASHQSSTVKSEQELDNINMKERNISCSTKLNLVWANICLTHTEWRERGGQILRHGATNLTDRATMAALILCQLLSWPHQSWGENGRGKMMRGWEGMGKRFPQSYYNNCGIIYTFH